MLYDLLRVTIGQSALPSRPPATDRTGWCRLARDGAGRCRLARDRTGWCRLARDGAGWCRLARRARARAQRGRTLQHARR